MAELKTFLVLVVAAVLPVLVLASPHRLGTVYLDSRFEREASSEGAGFSGKYVSLQGDGIQQEGIPVHYHSQ